MAPPERAMNTKDLREKRKKLAEDANALLSAAVKEGRANSTEEIQKYDAIMADVDALGATIERAERAAELERSYVPDSQRVSLATGEPDQQAIVNKAFRSWAAGGPSALSADELRALNPKQAGNGTEITLRFLSRDEREQVEKRAQTVTTTAGGYVIAPDFSNRLEKSMLFFGGMLTEADMFDTSTGAPLTWPTYDDTSNVGAVLGINTGVSNQDITFGQVSFGAFKYSSKQVLVPVELMQDSAFDVNALVADVLGERLGRILNTHFTTGAARPCRSASRARAPAKPARPGRRPPSRSTTSWTSSTAWTRRTASARSS
jgi:HK97 family phage major capsid protein